MAYTNKDQYQFSKIIIPKRKISKYLSQLLFNCAHNILLALLSLANLYIYNYGVYYNNTVISNNSGDLTRKLEKLPLFTATFGVLCESHSCITLPELANLVTPGKFRNVCLSWISLEG